ncbi:hypothetical protein HOC99_04075 [Candidatus Woesearchaeota archaeon]|nr:hypothetical protein [Candidatus Woesearchaeota archaeon]MBT7849088.1 hypothetical protein [Candidatus Woesearchaeota archaeon]MBT7962825.1 hypothetical protein [Candidatus Woesearchaeota archaeon]
MLLVIVLSLFSVNALPPNPETFSGNIFIGSALLNYSDIEIRDLNDIVIYNFSNNNSNYFAKINFKNFDDNTPNNYFIPGEQFYWYVNGLKVSKPSIDIAQPGLNNINYDLYIEESCYDEIKNNDESDIDCGGNCQECNIGKYCSSNSDCNEICINNMCSLKQRPSLDDFNIINDNGLIINFSIINDDGYNLDQKILIESNRKSSVFNLIDNKIDKNNLKEFENLKLNISLVLSDVLNDYLDSFKLEYYYETKSNIKNQSENLDLDETDPNIEILDSNIILKLQSKPSQIPFSLKLVNNENQEENHFDNISKFWLYTLKPGSYSLFLLSDDFNIYYDKLNFTSNETKEIVLKFINSYELDHEFNFGLEINNDGHFCPKKGSFYQCKNECNSVIKINECIVSNDSIFQITKLNTEEKKYQIGFFANNDLEKKTEAIIIEKNAEFDISTKSFSRLLIILIFVIFAYLLLETFFSNKRDEFEKNVGKFKQNVQKNINNKIQIKEIKFSGEDYIEIQNSNKKNISRINVEKRKLPFFELLTKKFNKLINSLVSNIKVNSVEIKELEKDKIDPKHILKITKGDHVESGLKVSELQKYYLELKLFFEKYKHLKEEALVSHIKKSKLNKHFLIQLYNLANNSRFNGKLAKKFIPEMEINKLKVIIYPKVETAFKIMIFYYYINKMKNTFTRTRILEFVFYNFNDIELIYNVISNLNHN